MAAKFEDGTKLGHISWVLQLVEAFIAYFINEQSTWTDYVSQVFYAAFKEAELLQLEQNSCFCNVDSTKTKISDECATAL